MRDPSEEPPTDPEAQPVPNSGPHGTQTRSPLEQEPTTPSADDTVTGIRARVLARLSADGVLRDLDAGRRRET
ncbi:hypothetical protein ACFWJT_20905 [Streptomyces sp. NPDC127069]|uniref:hypothetical protein n=1 Tax=Streptomyces sp. NPDC127069 TaxID=3347128 RepID=UPI0036669F16